MIFPRLRHLRPRAGEGTAGERLFRFVLLLGVFALVAWGFWANMERRMESLGVKGQIQDAGGLLSAEDKKHLEADMKRFQTRFDLRLEVRVLTGPFNPDSWQGKSVLLAVAPATKQVIFTAPPLVRHALGEPFMEELVDAFGPFFTPAETAAQPLPPDAWKTALFQALNMLERKLAELTR